MKDLIEPKKLWKIPQTHFINAINDEWYRKFGKENLAFLFEFVSDKFDINTFTENFYQDNHL